MKKLLAFLFSLLISFNSYGETYSCSYMHSGKANLTSMKRVDKSFVDSGLVRNIVFEDDKAIVLELTFSNNPPNFFVKFFNKQKNINNINCFSDEGDKWEKSNISFKQEILTLNFREKFKFRRGRVNCSLNDNGIWRWFGVQFSIEQN